ncbi:titin-like [Patiria miniata]|uniref:Uncharacterized protein n=1 Tax=Patiria miniata TaxID=46514 RepID=A0A913ZP95_PATMI|nr:titin-like [Patiria miniata]
MPLFINSKDVKPKVQVFVRTPPSHRSKTFYFELHPETSVSSLKETIKKKIGVEERHQRLYIRENVQLCDLLTLEENGVDKDELISLRLSLDDANDDDVPKDKASIEDEYLRDLSSKIESSWKELAKHLGYKEAEIADIQTTNEGSTEESRHMLLTWWEKTTDRNEAAQKLRRALEAIGLTDLAQKAPVTSESRDEAAGPEPERRRDAGVDEESKQNEAASTEEEKLKKERVGDQDKPQLISRRYVQVFIRSHCSHRPRIMCLQVDPETSVLLLKVIMSEKIGVLPQQQRLFIRRNFRNFELHNLLTLHDCGIHQDENISLRLCTDGLLGGGPKGKYPVDDQFFRDLASKTESSWEQLAKSLGYGEDEIKQFQKIYQENKERSLRMLLSWWRKQPNREEGFQSLRDALQSIGHVELALMIPSEEQRRMEQEEVADREKRGTSSEGRRPRQEETAHLDKLQPQVQLRCAEKQKEQKGTTSSENQRTCQEEVTHRDKHGPSVQVRGTEEQSRKKGTTSEGQRPTRDEIAHQDEPKPELHMGGAKKKFKQNETTSSEDQRQGQQEAAHRDKPQPEVQVRGANEHSRKRGATSSEDKRPEQEKVAHRDEPQPKVQVRGVKEQSRRKGASSSDDQRPEQEEVAHREEPQPEVQVRGAKEHSRKRGATSSEDQRPEREEVTHRDKTQPQVQMGVAKNKIKQNETTSSEDQRQGQQEAAHRDKPQPEVQVRGAKEQSRRKGASSSEDHRPEQDEVAHRDKPQPEVQVRWAKEHSRKRGATSSEDNRPEQEEVAHRDEPQPKVQVRGAKEQSGRKGASSSEDHRPEQEEVAHREEPKPPVQEGVTGIESRSAEVRRAHSSPSDAADQCRSELKDRYTTTGSYVQLIPWVDDDMKHIMNIYTELQLEKGDQDDIEGDVAEYGDIFLIKTKDGKVIRRAVLCGSPGMGKSTIIDKMAYDWAKGIALKTFTLLFVLKMSALDQTSELVESVFDQLLSDDTNVNKCDLEAFIKDNGSRVLILIDGFDEFGTTYLEPKKFGSILRMLNRKFGKECFVVVTTRPSQFAKLKSKPLIEKPFTHVKVLGFREEDIGQYVGNFFPSRLDDSEGLLDRIQSSDVLSDLARSPMILLLMCLIWREEETLPDTLSRLFSEAIRYIFQRKMPEILEEAMSEIVISIGRVALEGLVSPKQRLSFQEGEFEKSALDKAIKAGILTSQMVMKRRGTHNNVQFIHKTLQEYCAAMYWQSLLSKGDWEFQKILDKLGHPENFEYMLRFCCGDNQQCTTQILRMLNEKNLHDEDIETETVMELALNCYFESQTKDLLSVDFVESFLTGNIELSGNDSLNSFVWLLQHVAEETESSGVDYFDKSQFEIYR